LCSATLPKRAKIEVLLSLKIDDPEEIITDLNRANCYYNIIQGSGVDYTSGPSCLDFLFDDLTFNACTPEAIPKTLIYFEEIPVLLAFQAHLRGLLPAHLRAQGQTIVESYYSTRTTDMKTWVRAEFLVGTVCRIICTTEAFGMGMDISDIVRVFQWGLTKSVCSLIQRFGRAARNLKLNATCTLVVSREYFNITSEDDFQNTNDTQRKMEQNKPDLYKILRAKCLRQGFLDYLGVSNQYVEPAPGKCCSRCSQRALLDDVVNGTKGLCDTVKEAIRKEEVSVKTSQKTPSLIIEPVLEELRIWRQLVTRVMWGGDKPHSLFLPQGHIPDCVLEQLAKNVTSVVAPKEEKDRKTAGQASTWHGMKTWEVREPRLNDFLVRGWEKGMRLVEEENIKKKEARKARKIARQSKNGLNPVSKLPAKGTVKSIGPSHPSSVSRRGSSASLESVESN
jgi:helicase-like protein